MNEVKMKYETRFLQSERMRKLVARSRELAISGKRELYTADQTQLLYHWTEKCNAIVPQSGDWSYPKEQNMALGDHACRVDVGYAFPYLDQVPSRVEGYRADAESWGKDYRFLLDHSPAEIYPNEAIVGEFHWEMNEVRYYEFGEHVRELGRKAHELGAGGTSHGHTCSDLGIGLAIGWGGILENIDNKLEMYTRLRNEPKALFLRGAKYVCQGIIDYIAKHAEKARELAKSESDLEAKARYEKIAVCCANIATEPPKTYYEAVQWIQFAVMTDRIVGHGNAYGRIDLYLNPFYQADLAAGRITRDEAREYLAEIFLKLRGQFFALGGRLRDGSDATNEVSWIYMEAYDMVDDYNNVGVMWHEDMDPSYYSYVCDVLARHGAGIPSLVNYDLIKAAELRSGIPEEDAWTVAYSGCQWFCIPGREYCDQDVNAFIMLDPMWRAIERAIAQNTGSFEDLYALLLEEIRRTCDALRVFKDAQYEMLPRVWPEIATSLNCHGPVDRGLDMTDARGVDYQFTSTNILGIPNVADALFAIKRLVYEQKRYTLEEVKKAVDADWAGNESMRLRFLRQDKYGNDIDEADAFYVCLTDDIGKIVESFRNNRGQEYRPSLFHFEGHACVDRLSATPDGRHANEPLAHGCNPTAGRNTKGLVATANSLAKPHNVCFQGGSLQVELQPKFFDGKEKIGDYVENFSKTYFRNGGVQINLNIMDLEALRDAIDHPENPEYQNIIIKVTGYTARFICLDRVFQEEFLTRNNYEGM
jgi:formate C-acetyltransferase